MIAEIETTVDELSQQPGDDLAAIRAGLRAGVTALADATDWMLETHAAEEVMAVSVDYLMLAGFVCGGWQLARSANIAQQKLKHGQDASFYEAKLVTARFYAEHLLPKVDALRTSIKNGGVSMLALTEDQF